MLSPNTIDPIGSREFGKISIETKLIIDLLKDLPEGSTVSYEEIAEVISRSARPGSKGYSHLTSARRILIRDYSVVVDAEPKVGVRICTNDEKLVVSGRDIKRAHRAVRRSGQKLDAVDYNRLDEGKRKEWNARKSIGGALDLMSTQKAVKKVEALVTDAQLPSAKTLELFAK